ncbi:MAG: DUF3300 domain-containing protein [Glaciecola sp.]|nr:DUF3300 domain-containing protein [Glaciecola sp.]
MLVNTVQPNLPRWQRIITAAAISLTTLSLSGCVIAHTPYQGEVKYGFIKSPPHQTMTTTTTSYVPRQLEAGQNDDTVTVLDSALAPIALYPDSLLEHIFAAVVQPMDLIQAQTLIEQHNELDANELVELARGKPWDPSVIALLPFADVIANLTKDLEYLEYLGDAVEGDYNLVVSRVAYLRQQAQPSGYLGSVDYVKVIEKLTKIFIESAQPEVIFVPTYDPLYVYGTWWHGQQPRIWNYRHIKRHHYRHHNKTPRLGIHVSQGNVSINWNPFSYVSHNYWRDHYHIKQRHQLFSRRLHASHRAHNVHRGERWNGGKRLNNQRSDVKRDRQYQGSSKHRDNQKLNNQRRVNSHDPDKHSPRQVRVAPVKRVPVKLPPKRIQRNTSVQKVVRAPVKSPPKQVSVKRTQERGAQNRVAQNRVVRDLER